MMVNARENSEWLDPEINILIRAFRSGVSIHELSKRHRRSFLSIKQLLIDEGWLNATTTSQDSSQLGSHGETIQYQQPTSSKEASPSFESYSEEEPCTIFSADWSTDLDDYDSFDWENFLCDSPDRHE